jgi:hypothetical protein
MIFEDWEFYSADDREVMNVGFPPCNEFSSGEQMALSTLVYRMSKSPFVACGRNPSDDDVRSVYYFFIDAMHFWDF